MGSWNTSGSSSSDSNNDDNISEDIRREEEEGCKDVSPSVMEPAPSRTLQTFGDPFGMMPRQIPGHHQMNIPLQPIPHDTHTPLFRDTRHQEWIPIAHHHHHHQQQQQPWQQPPPPLLHHQHQHQHQLQLHHQQHQLQLQPHHQHYQHRHQDQHPRLPSFHEFELGTMDPSFASRFPLSLSMETIPQDQYQHQHQHHNHFSHPPPSLLVAPIQTGVQWHTQQQQHHQHHQDQDQQEDHHSQQHPQQQEQEQEQQQQQQQQMQRGQRHVGTPEHVARERTGSTTTATTALSQEFNQGTWSEEEHALFLQGYRECGRNWSRISKEYVITRTRMQVASHAQKWMKKMEKKKKKRK